jgi:hypothetical protein
VYHISTNLKLSDSSIVELVKRIGVNELKKLFSLCLLLFLVSCQSVQVNDSSPITEEEVVKALQENGVNLVEAEFPRSVFGSKLRNVKPRTYELSEKPFFIFEFETEIEREKGSVEFAEKTATMELVSSSTFEKRNILIFYVHEHDIKSDSVSFEKEIQEAIDGIKTHSDGIQSTGQVSSIINIGVEL